MKIAARNPAISVTIPAAHGDDNARTIAAVFRHLPGKLLDVGEALVVFAAGEKERLRRAIAESREHSVSIELPDITGRNQKNTAVSRGQKPGKVVDRAAFDNRRVGALRGRNLKLGHPNS
jgi:hypothetical protein